jgi:hypothetical protein
MNLIHSVSNKIVDFMTNSYFGKIGNMMSVMSLKLKQQTSAHLQHKVKSHTAFSNSRIVGMMWVFALILLWGQVRQAEGM